MGDDHMETCGVCGGPLTQYDPPAVCWKCQESVDDDSWLDLDDDDFDEDEE